MASPQRVELCSECDVNAKWYCLQDAANFCDEHNIVAHSLKSQKSHKIVSIDQKDDIIKGENAKPINCKNHHMPLCLYCLSCQDVCCVACLSVDIHKQHSNQVKSVVDVANEQKKTLNGHIEKLEQLKTTFSDEQNQLQQMLRNIDANEIKKYQEIDQEFDRIVEHLEARRKLLKMQLEEKSKTYRDNIYLRQDDIKNIDSSLNRCLEEMQHVLTLDDFAALYQFKTIIQKIKKLDAESIEYSQQSPLIGPVSFNIFSQKFIGMIDSLGALGILPTPSFVGEKCKANAVDMNIEWKPLESPLITAYALEIGENNNNFIEVYCGLKTQYHLEALKASTSYTLRLYACNEKECGNAALLEIKTLDYDLNNWTLSIVNTCPFLNVENTRDSLLDEKYTTGAAVNLFGNCWIQATFPYPVPVTSVTIAPLHKNSESWNPTFGNGGNLQYSNDNISWTTVGTIAYSGMQQQKIVVGNITAQYWRLFHRSHLGTSCFLFQ